MLLSLAGDLIKRTPPPVLSAILRRIPRKLLDLKQEEAFRDIVRYCHKHSPFYRRRFDELGIDPGKIKRPSDLGDFYTTTNDVIEHAEEFLCRKPEIVFESSGTTGRNKRIYFGQDELDDIGMLNALGFHLWGIKPDDRIVNAFDFCIWIPGILTQKGIEKSRIFGMAAGKIDPSEVYKRIPVYNFNVIFGEPTWLIKLTEMAEKSGSYPLKMIIGSAEGMPDAARPWMEKVWQGAKVRMVYASVEMGGALGCEISDECGGYHIDEDDFLAEIVSADKDGYGELVFTTLTRKTMPLIRYRNRDISRMIEGRCPCGKLPYRRMSLIRGRADEMVVASGGNLYPLMFENILKEIKEISLDWQIVFKLNGIKEVMEFNLELKDTGAGDKVKDEIFSNIRVKYPDLWKNYSLGIFETDFIFHSPQTLRKTRKLIRLLDERHAK